MDGSRFKKLRFEISVILACLLTAAVFITICSKNSFLYPMNDWGDANCFFTVGKAISKGKLLYRDIFEQKGPLLYFLYALAYRISPESFFGAYIIELLSFSAFLYTANKCLRLYTDKKLLHIGLLPFLACAVSLSIAFYHGGSVEELSLFCLTYGMYLFLRMEKGLAVSKKMHIASGLAIGYVFWIKYTVLGLFAGGFVYIFYRLVKQKKYGDIGKICTLNFLGFAFVSMPVVAYFIAENGLEYLWQGYFYNNIFVYSDGKFILVKLGLTLVYTVVTLALNIPYSVFAVLGIAWVFYTKKQEARLLAFLAGFSAFFIYFGGVNYKYYGLPLCIFAIFGMYGVAEWLGKNGWLKAKVFGVLLALLPLVSYLLGSNTYLMKYEKSDMPQYKFAETINKVDDPTLFNYGFLDGGFYFAADIVPTNKYFCKLNFESDEKTAETVNSILQGKTDFVVCWDKPLETDFEEEIPYVCVDTAVHYFQGEDHTYYLYQRVNVKQ
ncbi:MAG: hypothetical protein E7597_08820 [Ruminococcaceae bacterium]|nr:hypothetical protein [Oscillospiraceae bacterium]